MHTTICNYIMEILLLPKATNANHWTYTIGDALSRLASQQEASQENWFNLLNKNKVLAKSCYRGRLFVYFISYGFFCCCAAGLAPTSSLGPYRLKQGSQTLTLCSIPNFGKWQLLELHLLQKTCPQARQWYLRVIIAHINVTLHWLQA